MTAKRAGARAGAKQAAPSISFADASHRVRSLRQHVAVLAHLHELVITRFLAEGGPGNEPEFIAMLGREQVVVAEDIVDKVLLFLSDEIDRLRATHGQLESCSVALPNTPHPPKDWIPDGGYMATRDEVVINPAARSARPLKEGGPAR